MALNVAPAFLSDHDVVRRRWPTSSSPAISDRDVEPRETPRRVPVADDEGYRMATEWIDSQLENLRALPLNWDSYGGQPMSLRALQATRQLAEFLALEGWPWPVLVPRADGGIALEWDAPRAELVIELTATDDPLRDATALFADDESGDQWEDRLATAERRIADALTRLANR